MNANSLEIELSRVLLLIRELETGKPVDSHSSEWDGYMAGVYCGGDLRKRADVAVADLCSRLQKVDVSKFSPEMQIWWRDHQAADRKREADERKKIEQDALRAEARSKLTPDERAALNID
jgi:hypothetical protein